MRRNEKSSCGVFSSKQAKSIHQRLCHYCPDECKRCQKEQGLNSFPLLRSSVSESSWVGGFKVSVYLFSFWWVWKCCYSERIWCLELERAAAAADQTAESMMGMGAIPQVFPQQGQQEQVFFFCKEKSLFILQVKLSDDTARKIISVF